MSDDEFYDDEYADFHDMLYDADPDPDLADDLAEHAAYSPVWFDNPIEETREYFSDWEYYSDDYFDDDPVLTKTMVKGNTGSQVQSQQKRQPGKRGRKRKLSEVRAPAASFTRELNALHSCIKGTVWKTASPEPVQNHKIDLAPPVALRLSKAIMRSAYNTKQGFGRGKLLREESWANELSLADMGLRTEKSMDIHRGSEAIAAGDAENSDYEADRDEEDGVDDTGMSVDIEVKHSDFAEGLSSQTYYQSEQQKSGRPETAQGVYVEVSEDERHFPSKKRKLLASESSTETKDTPDTPQTSYASDAPETNMELEPEETKEPQKRGRGRPKKRAHTPQQTEPQPADAKSSNPPTRKRKAAAIESSATASTASTRAKRVATVDVSENLKQAGEAMTKADGRPTRRLRDSTVKAGQSKKIKK